MGVVLSAQTLKSYIKKYVCSDFLDVIFICAFVFIIFFAQHFKEYNVFGHIVAIACYLFSFIYIAVFLLKNFYFHLRGMSVAKFSTLIHFICCLNYAYLSFLVVGVGTSIVTLKFSRLANFDDPYVLSLYISGILAVLALTYRDINKEISEKEEKER